jgi:sugar (pentulose or hexulose) kinase
MLRACYEGVAFAMMDCYQHMPLEVKQITVCGGGSSSSIWCQMFADAVGGRVITVSGDELGAKGTIISNAVAQGLYTDYYEAVKETVKVQKVYESNKGNHEEYLKYYKLYKKTYEGLMESWNLRHEILFD